MDRFLKVSFQINSSKNNLHTFQGAGLFIVSNSSGFDENFATINFESLCCGNDFQLCAKAAISVFKFSCVNHLSFFYYGLVGLLEL